MDKFSILAATFALLAEVAKARLRSSRLAQWCEPDAC